jgi:transposase InsO family protein
MRGLPYADHCRVLEEMFPSWTAEQLFRPSCSGRGNPGRRPSGRANRWGQGYATYSRTTYRLGIEVRQRVEEDVIVNTGFHTGQGSEYTAGSFRRACERLGIVQSMGRPGSALDNSVIESWHSTLEFELRSLHEFATRAEARTAVAAWIEDHNHVRRHDHDSTMLTQ